MNAIDRAFEEAKRADFLPDELRNKATLDVALSIGFGQTNSQPSTVKQMLEWLEVEPGQKILDVGSGSGWTTALLAHLVGPHGQIYAVEKIVELVDFGRENCRQAGVNNAHFFLAKDGLGLPKFAPYDRILVSASSYKLPEELLGQLKIGGKMVVPVVNDILEITKIPEKENDITVHSGFVFVPLVHS